MIYLYSGTPGSGKSLHCASTIYYRLKKGDPVIANFTINTANIKNCRGSFDYVANSELDPQYLRDFSNEYFEKRKFQEEKILLVIDECQIMFNAREWNKPGRDDWFNFFTNHRKYGYTIVLIAQFDRMIDRQIRSLIEYEYRHRKVSNFGVGGKIVSLFALGSLFVSVKFWYPIKEKIGADFFRANKKFYSLYDTYSKFDK